MRRRRQRRAGHYYHATQRGLTGGEKMNEYIEELVRQMLQLMAELKPLERDALGWELWLVNKEN